jgi:acetyltransferase-like isoleucine patch superfamily enzyme
LQGIVFRGEPRYIDFSVRLDALGGLTIGEGIVMSVDVLVLTHDYSITVGLSAAGQSPTTDMAIQAPVTIGARAVIMPGTVLGDHVIVDAGAVVRGVIPNDSIVVGNPAVVVKRASEWAVAKLKSTPENQIHRDVC